MNRPRWQKVAADLDAFLAVRPLARRLLINADDFVLCCPPGPPLRVYREADLTDAIERLARRRRVNWTRRLRAAGFEFDADHVRPAGFRGRILEST